MLGEKAQASLEYLYLTAFVIALAAVTALLVQDLMSVQENAKTKILELRDELFNKIIE